MEFLRAEGYDQLGEDEKEVLACGNCVTMLVASSCLATPLSMAFFYPPLPNLPELNVIKERFMAARTGAKTFVGQVINMPIEPGSLLKVLPCKLPDDLVLNVCIKKHIFHKSGPFHSLINVSSLSK